MTKTTLILATLVLLAAATALRAADTPTPGTTRIARWKDDRTAAFLLMFDDSCPSHWQVAIPELVKRGLIGTFYLNPGKAEYTKFRAGWETTYWKQGMVYADHTMTHKGVHSLDEAEHEIGDCAAIIRQIMPPDTVKLLSYGQPGVGPNDWKITPAQLDALLQKHHLISRPPLPGHMAVYHLKTTAAMLALADQAIANKSVEFIVIHGVERITPDWHYQDFWAIKQDIFMPLLDGLKTRADHGDLWITDHISAHQYETERNGATVRVRAATAGALTLELQSPADRQFYNAPLTLITPVPAAWKTCQITQGQAHCIVPATGGTIRYDATPGADTITITPQ